MVHGIPSRGGPEWSNGALPAWKDPRRGQDAPQTRVQARASALDARAAALDVSVSRAGALQVTTDDGDTISISFATLDQLHAESFHGGTRGAGVAYSRLAYSHLAYQGASQTSSVSVDINVNGSLDDKELSDIGRLLQQLSQAIYDPKATPDPAQFADGGVLASLDVFQFAYQEQTHAEYSSSQVLATA